MGLITITQMEDGVDASANLWNSRFGTIVDEMNGKLDATNLANEAITTAKLAPGSVTNDKLAFVSEYDNDGNFINMGNFMIQWGTNLITASGTEITFARSFLDIPTITVTTTDTNQQSAWITARATNKFTIRQPWTPSPLYVSWIAVGPA